MPAALPDESVSMGTRIRQRDWSQSLIGPLDRWPLSLKRYVDMIVEMPTPAIIFWGPDKVQLYNDGYAVIMGPRHPKYLGATYRECWPDTWPTINPWMDKVLATGEVIQVQDTLFTLTRHGYTEEAYFTFTFSPLRDDEGKIAGILQPVVEVTANVLGARRTKTLWSLSSAARDRKASFSAATQLLSENAQDVAFCLVYLWDAEHQRMDLRAQTGFAAEGPNISETGTALLQRARTGSEAFSIDVNTFLGAPHRNVWEDLTAQAFVAPLGRGDGQAATGVCVFGLSTRLRFDDNYRQFLESVVRALSSVLGAEQELAFHRERERLLAAAVSARRDADSQRALLADLFSQAPAAIAMFSGPKHVFTLANDRFRQAICGPRKVLGLPLEEALPELVEQGFIALMNRVFQTGEAFVGRDVPAELIRGPDGQTEQTYWTFVYQPTRDHAGAVDGIAAFGFEVTDAVAGRKRAETLAAEREQAIQLRDEFLSVASHELKTPLTPLSIRLQALRREARAQPPSPFVDRVAEQLEMGERQVKKLAELIGDLLDVSRIAAGRLTVEREPLDLVAVTRDVVGGFAAEAERSRCRVDVFAPATMALVADRLRLEQVISNLLSNAVKYAPGKPIEVRLAEHEGRARLTVRDFGIGIEPSNLQRIFEKFERAVSVRHYGGLGLGLFVAREIVHALGGTISATSEAGNGALFTVELPLTPS